MRIHPSKISFGEGQIMSFRLHGPLFYRWLSFRVLLHASMTVTRERFMRRRLVQSWAWGFEVANVFARKHLTRAMAMSDLSEARVFEDSIEFDSPLALGMQVENSTLPSVQGRWHYPENASRGRTVLYFHGGGYAFFSAAHSQMIGHIACAARSKIFSLDYRLSPENKHPAQLEDALAAYRVLLDSGHDARHLVVAGDSAGGHLMLLLLRELRNCKLPMPALAIGLCPWTDLDADPASLSHNDRYDWVQSAMTRQFAEWFIGSDRAMWRSLSPVNFDVVGFPPIYLQAGEKEILYDMICRFASHVADSGGEVTLDVWPDMTHDFQAYGQLLEDSRAALNRIGDVVEHYLEGTLQTPFRFSRHSRTPLTSTST
jgi:acetyl esterase/lipase